MTLRTLTHSSVSTYTDCPKAFDYSYNKSIYPTGYPAALTMGTATHEGTESFKRAHGLDAGLASAATAFDRQLEQTLQQIPEDAAQEVRDKAARDAAKVRAMLRAYWDSYHEGGPGDPPLDRELDFVLIEQKFQLPMLNPRTGRQSRTFNKAGRTDGIVRLRPKPDAGLFVYELKTTSDTLDSIVESLRHSVQPPTYQELAIRTLGKPITGTVVDVVKKPVIRGRKTESLQEFEKRCLAAYRDEPERFFRRVEIAHDEAKVRNAMEVFWQTARAIREADRHGYVAPQGPKCRKTYGWCEYKALCWYGNREGYRLGDYAHEELEIEE